MWSLTVDASAWVCLCGDEGAVKSSAPVLHGTYANGSPFVLPLSFAGVQKEQRKLAVPGQQGDVEAVAVCGSATVPSGPSLDWQLTLIPHMSGVILQLRLKVTGGHAGCHLDHITLGTTELELGSVAPPPASQDTTAAMRNDHVGAWTLLAGAASVAAAVTLTPVSAVAASALAAGAPVAAYYRSRRTKGEPLTAFLINGWQSFSFSGAIPADEPQPLTSLPLFSGAFHTGAAPPPAAKLGGTAAPLPTHALVSDLFAMVLSHGGGGGDGDGGGGGGGGGGGDGGGGGGGVARGLFLGFLTARRGVGGVSASADACRATLFTEQPAALGSGAAVETDWAMILPVGPAPAAAAAAASTGTPTKAHAHLRALRCYAHYTESVAAHSGVPAARAGRALGGKRGTVTPVGWCSWYCHGPKVSESLMLETIAQLGAARASVRRPCAPALIRDRWCSLVHHA